MGHACITVPAERAYKDRMVQERITKFKDLMEDTGPVLRWEVDAVSNLTEPMRVKLPRLKRELEKTLYTPWTFYSCHFANS